MYLERVDIARLRNLSEVSFEPGSGLNILFGENGSGKSSVLEGIHMLGLGRSFRTRHPGKVVQFGAQTLVSFGVIRGAEGDHRVGIERGAEGKARVRIDGENADSLAAAARVLPIQTLTPNGHELLEGGPAERRAMLDWGLFHVEQEYFSLWQRYGRALKQRNAALRGTSTTREADGEWDRILAAAGESVGQMRRSYLAGFAVPATRLLNELLGRGFDVGFQYRQGWSEGLSLAEALHGSVSKDRERGFTGRGPHRADVVMMIDGVPAVDMLSRGQQKMAVAALKLAQVDLLAERGGTRAVVLVDDLTAELDLERRRLLLEWFAKRDIQAFISVIEKESLEPLLAPPYRMFHVEHGTVQRVV